MTVGDVLDLIVPKGVEYTLVGNPLNSQEYSQAITWHSNGLPPSWDEIQAGFLTLEQALTNKAASKQALLNKLGITEDEAKLLLS